MGFYNAGGGTYKHTELLNKENAVGIIDHEKDSVRETQLYNIEALRKLLATQPDKASYIKRKSCDDMILGTSNANSITCDENYLYVCQGGSITPGNIGRVYKIDRKTMTTILPTWQPSELNYISSGRIVFDGKYLYVNALFYPGYPGNDRIYKIDRKTMTTVGNYWESPIAGFQSGALCSDGTYIYARGKISPGEIYKIRTSDMTTVGSPWDGTDEPGLGAYIINIIFDGTFIYAIYLGNTVDAGYVIKIDPITMTTVSEAGNPWTNTDLLFDSTYDGSFIYVTVRFSSPPSPQKLYKINPITWTSTSLALSIDAATVLYFDGNYLYSGGLSPAKIIKINPVTMSEISIWTGLAGTDKYPRSITSDGLFLYIAITPPTPPYCKVIRKIIRDIDETEI
jgi:hypothetical protein